MTIEKMLSKITAISSMAEGRRAVTKGAVKLNGFLVTKLNAEHEFHVGDIVEIGKRKFEIKKSHLECDNV